MYSNFTIEEAGDIGKKFKAKCRSSYRYEGQLTIDKEYEIEIKTRIMPMSPLCSFLNDRGRMSECHLERFEKTGDIE